MSRLDPIDLRDAAPSVVAPLDHHALQRRGHRRRGTRRAGLAGGAVAAALVAIAVVAPVVDGAAPPPFLGNRQEAPHAEPARAWPSGGTDTVSWTLRPAVAADGAAAGPGCELWLAYEPVGGPAGGQPVCAPGRMEVVVDRVTVSDDDGPVVDLLLVMAGDGRATVRIDLDDQPRLQPRLVDLGSLDAGPSISFGVVVVEPGTGVAGIGG